MDVGGIFRGSEYLVRITKGELNLNGYRYMFFTDTLQRLEGKIQKRGRKTIVKMLQAKGVVKTQKDRALLLWGV